MSLSVPCITNMMLISFHAPRCLETLTVGGFDIVVNDVSSRALKSGVVQTILASDS